MKQRFHPHRFPARQSPMREWRHELVLHPSFKCERATLGCARHPRDLAAIKPLADRRDIFRAGHVVMLLDCRCFLSEVAEMVRDRATSCCFRHQVTFPRVGRSKQSESQPFQPDRIPFQGIPWPSRHSSDNPDALVSKDARDAPYWHKGQERRVPRRSCGSRTN